MLGKNLLLENNAILNMARLLKSHLSQNEWQKIKNNIDINKLETFLLTLPDQQEHILSYYIGRFGDNYKGNIQLISEICHLDSGTVIETLQKSLSFLKQQHAFQKSLFQSKKGDE